MQPAHILVASTPQLLVSDNYLLAPRTLCIEVPKGQSFLKNLTKIEFYRNSNIEPNNSFDFVKIISIENGNFTLALQKRLFCDAKPTLLPCKTAAFGTQNNRFCKALIKKMLCKSYACEKYLHFYKFLFAYKMVFHHSFLLSRIV